MVQVNFGSWILREKKERRMETDEFAGGWISKFATAAQQRRPTGNLE